MRNRLLLNVLLLLVVAILFLTYLWLPEHGDEYTLKPLADFVVDDVANIRIERPGSDTIELQRDTADWHLLQPFMLPAAADRVRGVLLLPQLASLESFAAAEQDLAQYGLADPPLTIRFDNETIALGDPAPLNEQRYVLYRDRIHLIPDRLFAQLNTPASYYIDTRLVPVAGKPSRITLPTVELLRDDSGWHSTSRPAGDNATGAMDAAVVARAWQETRAMTAREFSRDDMNAAAALPPVQIEFDEQPDIEYLIISAAPQLILARPELGIQYHLDSRQAQALGLQEPAAHTPLLPAPAKSLLE